MELIAIALTVVAGLLMGAINNIAGGAGVFGLLAFEYGFGMPLATANPSTRLAAVAVGSFACLGFLRAGDAVTLNREHLIHDAKRTALALLEGGYDPKRTALATVAVIRALAGVGLDAEPSPFRG